MRRHWHQAASREYFREQAGENLLRARETAKLTRDELAARSGVDARLIKMVEEGVRSLHLESALALSEALERPLDTIVLDINWVPARTTAGHFARPGRCCCGGHR